MCRKLICLISFVAVLIMAHNVSAGLVGHWKFDEGSGTTVADASGRGNHGTFGGNASWGTGNLGGALSLDGSSWAEIPPAAWSPIERQVTVAFWAFGGDAMPVNHFVFAAYSADTNNARQASAHIPWGNGTMYWDTGYDGANYDRVSAALPAQYQKGAWVHWVFTKNVNTGTVNVYINGALFLSGAGATRPIKGVNAFTIGVQAISGHPQGYIGRLDDFRLYDRATTADEVLGLFNGVPPTWPKAEAPIPADGTYYADTWVNLGWSPGEFAVSHNVYVGDNFDDVNAGTGDTFRGNQATASLLAGFPGFPFPGGLVPGTTYYWRIDEVNPANPGSPWKGNIWSFTVPPKKAYRPGPPDGAEYAAVDVTLSWTAGLNAKLHYVYFGDNFDTVNNATASAPRGTTTYTPAGPLAKGKTYYWRVDEFDGAATHKGNVWSFSTIPVIAITNPNLLGWWKLDQGFGSVAVDFSGHENHGTINNVGGGLGQGGSAWDTDPERDVALSFNGDNTTGTYVSAGRIPAMTLTNGFTWAFWTRQDEGQGRAIPGQGNDVILGNRYGGTASPLQFIKFTQGRFEYYNTALNGVIDYEDIPAGVWVHHAVVKNAANLTYYRNGEVAGASTTTATIDANPLYMGGDAAGERWRGRISDVRIYDRALTQQEVRQTMRGDLLRAWNPSPNNRAIVDVERARQPLTWSAGDKASQHDVYFSLDKDAVGNAGASDTTGVYRGRQSATTYTPAEGVQWGSGPYYWRIDEVNTDGTVTSGSIWSFSVANYLVVDDIESYNDLVETDPASNRIYTKWIDGYGTTTNGAVVGNLDVPLTERANVHGGGQAMPLSYDNNRKFSEATLTLAVGRDWTREGVANLSLWFRGATTNAAEKMYVVLNGTAVVYNNDTTLTQKTGWTEWVIPLQQFAGLGVNLTNVTSITIGFGTRGNTTTAGGTGQMYIDDIRLYRSTVVP